MRKYVESDKKGYTKEIQSIYDRRLKRYAVQALKDLALLAEKLPEEQQVEIFSERNMCPFFAKLLSLKGDGRAKRRRRIIDLWHAIFSSNASLSYALQLVGKEVWQVLQSQPVPHLQAIYFATLFREQPSQRR